MFGGMIGDWGDGYDRETGHGRSRFGNGGACKPKECCFLIEIDMLHPTMTNAVCWSVNAIMDKAERAVQFAEEKDRQREQTQMKLVVAKKQQLPPQSGKKKKGNKEKLDEMKDDKSKRNIESKALNKKGSLVAGQRNSEWLILYHVPGPAIKVIKSSADIRRGMLFSC